MKNYGLLLFSKHKILSSCFFVIWGLIDFLPDAESQVKVNYNVLENDAYKKNVIVSVGPYGYMFGENSGGFGFEASSTIMIKRFLTLNGLCRNIFLAKDFKDDFYANRGFYYTEIGGNIHLSDKISSTKEDLEISASSSGYYTYKTLLKDVPLEKRKIKAVRIGYCNLKIPLRLPEDAASAGIYAFGKYYLYYVGYSISLNHYAKYYVENHGYINKNTYMSFFIDLMYTPNDILDGITYSRNYSDLESHGFGFRLGWRYYSILNRIKFPYSLNFEIGYYPGIRGEEELNDVYFYISWEIPFSTTLKFLMPKK